MDITRTTARDTEFLLSFANSERSFERIVIPSGQGKLQSGTLLKADNTKAVDGDDAVKVLYQYVDATSESVAATAVVRDAEVHGELLIWEADTTNDEKLLAAVDLEAKDIIVRWTNKPIKSGDAHHLEFMAQPFGGETGESIGPVVVHVKDVFGALVNGSSLSITLTKTSGSGTLTGGGASAAVNGVATWAAVSFSAAGTFTFTAAGSGVTSAVSESVVITAA